MQVKSVYACYMNPCIAESGDLLGQTLMRNTAQLIVPASIIEGVQGCLSYEVVEKAGFRWHCQRWHDRNDQPLEGVYSLASSDVGRISTIELELWLRGTEVISYLRALQDCGEDAQRVLERSRMLLLLFDFYVVQECNAATAGIFQDDWGLSFEYSLPGNTDPWQPAQLSSEIVRDRENVTHTLSLIREFRYKLRRSFQELYLSTAVLLEEERVNLFHALTAYNCRTSEGMLHFMLEGSIHSRLTAIRMLCVPMLDMLIPKLIEAGFPG